MKTRVIHVPRSLVKYHMPHPEAYGESIVVLENDMTTDVYTFDDGKLYTETNNKGLINFLMKANSDDKKTVIEQDYLSLVSISLDDVHQLKTWFQKIGF